MIACTILVYDRMTSILFALISTYLYLSIILTFGYYLNRGILDSMNVGTLIRNSIVVTHVYHTCYVMFMGI